MPRICMTLVVALFIVTPGLVMAETIQAKHEVELEDPAGDVMDGDGDLGKDVRKLVISSDGTELQVTAVLEKDIAHYLAGRKAGDVLQMNIDMDNEAATGGKTFWGGKQGFEYLVSVRTCIAYKDGGEACSGGLSGADPEKYFSSYQVAEFAQGKTDTKNTHDIFWESPRIDIQENVVTSKILYSDLGVSSGQTIRMAVREADSSYDAESFFPDIVFTLK